MRRTAKRAGETRGVRDETLEIALRRLAAEAATRLSSLLASGEQIPFDVAESTGEESFFHSYVPLTERFVAERSDEIRCLPAFEPACEAVMDAGVAAPFMETLAIGIPADPHERAAQMLTFFLAALWDGRAEFSLDARSLDQALRELEAETRDLESDDLLVCPLVGFGMEDARIDLPSGVRIVRADAVDAPLEAMRSEGMERRPWQPQFLALVFQDEGHEGSAAAMHQLHELITVMRLFKEGSVGLGPYAFAPTGEGRWRRLATGSSATRSGGYHLTGAETTDLIALARSLEARPDPSAGLSWAMSRFELGCERETALDGLSDHLLALAALLEGDGPIGAPLPVRAAALFGAGGSEDEAREKVWRATRLERALMTGTPDASGEDTGQAMGIATWIEEGLRGIVRSAALGELGGDISLAADEALISAGMELGEGSAAQMGATSEWDAIPDPIEAADEAIPEEDHYMASDHETPEDGITRILEPVPDDAGEIRITAVSREDREHEFDHIDDFEAHAEAELDATFEPDGVTFNPFAGEEFDESTAPIDLDARRRVVEGGPSSRADWLSEISAEAGQTLEWPTAESGDPRPAERQRVDTPRVRHLFPVPDDAEWSVPELDYHR